MTKVSVQYKKVARPIESVTITINEEQLKTLIVILNRIGGCPDNSPRKHAEDIRAAIQKALEADGTKLNMTDSDKMISYKHGAGSIYFEDYQ